MEQQPLRILAKHWRAGAAALVVCLGLALALSATATKMYKAHASLYFALSSGNTGTELNQGGQYVLGQMPSYQELATSSVILGPASESLGGAEITSGNVATTVPSGTTVLDIAVTTSSRTGSAQAANAVAGQLKLFASAVAPESAQGKVLVKLESVRIAVPPKVPSSPRKIRDLLAGLAAGLLLFGLLAYALEAAAPARRASQGARVSQAVQARLDEYEAMSREPA